MSTVTRSLKAGALAVLLAAGAVLVPHGAARADVDTGAQPHTVSISGVVTTTDASGATVPASGVLVSAWYLSPSDCWTSTPFTQPSCWRSAANAWTAADGSYRITADPMWAPAWTDFVALATPAATFNGVTYADWVSELIPTVGGADQTRNYHLDRLPMKPGPLSLMTIKKGAAPVVGEKLIGTTNAWSDTAVTPTDVYVWKRDGVVLQASTNPEYTPVAADVGHRIGLSIYRSAAGYDRAPTGTVLSGIVADRDDADAGLVIAGLR